MGRKCQHPSCLKEASYGVKGSGRRQFCTQHAEREMVLVATGTRCASPGCSKCASYGVQGGKRTFCAQHAEREMVLVATGTRCASPGCSKCASYGVQGGKRTFCAQHAEREMVLVVTGKRCASPGCSKYANYGVQGGKRTFCGQHADEDMVVVNGRRCASLGCSKYASYGVQGGKRTFCVQHAADWMVRLTGKRCTHRGGFMPSAFGVENNGTLAACATLAVDRVVHVDSASQRCSRRQFSTFAGFGNQDLRDRESCVPHARPEAGDFNLVKGSIRRCFKRVRKVEGDGDKRAFCAGHLDDGVGDLAGLGQFSVDLRDGAGQPVRGQADQASVPDVTAAAPAPERQRSKRARTAIYCGQRFQAIGIKPGPVMSPALAFSIRERPVLTGDIAKPATSAGVLEIKPEGGSGRF